MKIKKPGDWVKHFETHRGGWKEPDWTDLPPSLLDVEKRILLANSLAIFQLGESGGGTRLRRFVRRTLEQADHRDDYLGYQHAVDLFLAEENEHARLLAELVGYLGGQLRQKHWMNGLFRKTRTLLGLEFNLQVLLTAELIAEVYYGLLYQRVPDPVIRTVCGRIVRDEVGHIGFHRSFFHWRQRTQLPGATVIWSLQFQFLFLVAETLVWRTHGACLGAFGIERSLFVHRARAVCRRFLEGLDGQSLAPEIGEQIPNPVLVENGAGR